jgi:hypothetical protein
MFEIPSTSTNLLKGLEVLLQNDAIWDQPPPPPKGYTQEYIYYAMHV